MPVLNALLQRIPELKLTIRSAAPRTLLENLISSEFEHLCEATDFGMHMASAVEVLSQESAQDYVSFHRDWDNRIAQESELLLKMAPDLVLVSMGGMQMQLPMNQWPRIPGVRWIVKQSWGVCHPDVFEQEALGMHYTDVLCSCDALLTKPGYGNFTEAGVSGVPVLYLSRQDWPEEHCLVEWLQQHGRCLEVQRAQLESGDLETILQALWNHAPKPSVLPDGVAQAADIVEHYLLAAI